VLQALAAFGAPLHDLSAEDLTQPDLAFPIGVQPARIDLLTEIDGVAFDEAWAGRLVSEIDGLRLPIIGRAEFIRNKQALGRTKDLANMEALGQG
jgi:hypothetical protein